MAVTVRERRMRVARQLREFSRAMARMQDDLQAMPQTDRQTIVTFVQSAVRMISDHDTSTGGRGSAASA